MRVGPAKFKQPPDMCSGRTPATCIAFPVTSSARPHYASVQTLKKHGYLYDSTLIERWYTWNPTSPSADAMLLPYTMDFGIPQVLGGQLAGAGQAGHCWAWVGR